MDDEEVKIKDVEVKVVGDVYKHPFADRLDIATIDNWNIIVGKDSVKPGDSVVFIHPDACLNMAADWCKDECTYIGRSGRVRTIKIKGKFSEGIILPIATVQKFFPDSKPLNELSQPELADLLEIKHYYIPMTNFGNLMLRGPGLPYNLPKTDQENYQSMRKTDIIGKPYLVTRKLDGSSCTICIRKDSESSEDAVYKGYEVHISSRKLDLKLDGDNIYIRAAKPVIESILNHLKESEDDILGNDVLVVRGEVTGEGINTSGVNKDCIGDPTFHTFEFFKWNPDDPDDKVKFEKHGCKSDCDINCTFEYATSFGKVLNPVPVLRIIDSLTEKDCLDYLGAPATDGEGVVLWEISKFNDDHTVGGLNGLSFKIRSQDYDSKL